LDPAEGPVQAFAHALRELRRAGGGMPYRAMAKSSHYSVTALSEAAGGVELPSLAVAFAFVEACGGDRAQWEQRWRSAVSELAAAGQEAAQARANGAAEPPPYLGLATFQPADADRFFGRDQVVSDLAKQLADGRLLAVFGPSGSGKSSLLRAGLIPAIRAGQVCGSEDWPVLLFEPGERPMHELATRLARSATASAEATYQELTADPAAVGAKIRAALTGCPASTSLLIVVDQFEEVFTLCRNAQERTRFIDVLVSAADVLTSRARVVLGVRADFYARCADYPALVSALRGRQVLVGPMGEQDLRAVIAEPALRAGLKVEPELVATLLGDVGGEPGALPLVSHALLETWKGRRGRSLTLADYRRAGGVRGAIAQTADAVLDSLDDRQREIARNVFLRLTAPGDGTEDTRRHARCSELLDTEQAHDTGYVLARLAAARLITVDQDTVTVAHESLIRNWPTLQGWLNTDRELLRAHRRLTDAAVEWQQHDRDDELLYRGTRLLGWDELPTGHLNQLEHAFLTASVAQRTRDAATRRRRVRLTIGGLNAGLVCLSVLAAVAFVQAGRAADQRDLATSRQLVANATGQLARDPELSLLLARRAHAVRPTAETESALRQATLDSAVRVTVDAGDGEIHDVAYSADGALMAGAGEKAVLIRRADGTGTSVLLQGHGQQVRGVAFSPAGDRLAASSLDGTVRVWNVAGHGEPLVLHGPESGSGKGVEGVAFSPDGRWVAGAGRDGGVRVWPVVGKGDPILLKSGPERVLDVAFSPDGTRLASGGGENLVRVWTLADRSSTVLGGHSGVVEAVAFSPDGRSVASASLDGTVRVAAADGTGTAVVLRGHDGTAEGVAFSPDSARVASAGNDGTVRVWSADGSGDPVVLHGHTGPTWSVAFAPDGQGVLSGSSDGTLRAWQASGAGDPLVLRGHTAAAYSAVFSPDGSRVASTGEDGTVRIWPANGQGRAVILAGPPDVTTRVAFSADGRRIVVAGMQGTLYVRPVGTGGTTLTLPGHRGRVMDAAFSPDGTHVASAGEDGTVRLWPADGHGEPVKLRGHTGAASAIAYTPDGRHVVSGGKDGTVRLWPTDGQGNPVVLTTHQNLVWSVAVSADGRHVVSGGDDGTVRVSAVDRRTRPVVLRGHQGLVWSVAFSPDGRWLATTGNDKTVRLWDWATGNDPVVFRGHVEDVNSVAFGPDGQRLVGARQDGTVVIWKCDVCGPEAGVLALSTTRVTRDFSAEERRVFLHE
jgi:WD40 repeat protein/energy-coupling factor transporter ATP-binding protein EcfA2